MSDRNQIYVQAAPSNGLGVAGFVISLIGLVITGGILCPIGLILSFIALFRQPRGFAIAGTILGAIGTIVPVVLFLIFGAAVFSFCSCLGMGIAAAANEQVTISALNDAERQIQDHYATHSALPSEFEGNNLIDAIRDKDGRRLRYTPLPPSSYEIRSSGIDGRFGTSDDRVRTGMGGAPSTTLPRVGRPTTTTRPRIRRSIPPLEPSTTLPRLRQPTMPLEPR
jgi:hypothetical protein